MIPNADPRPDQAMPPEPVPESFAERLAEDLSALAAACLADITGVVARMVAELPAPILPHHHYGRNGAAMAMVQAIRALRPLAVAEIHHAEQIIVSCGERVAFLFIDIPLRTRSITLTVPLDDVAGYNGHGEWRWDDALAAEIFRPIPPESELELPVPAETGGRS